MKFSFCFFELRFAPQAGTHAAKPAGLCAKHEGAGFLRRTIIASNRFPRQAISHLSPSLTSRKFLTQVKTDCAIPASGRFPLQTVSCFGQSTKGASCVGQIIASDRFSRQAISHHRPSLTSEKFLTQVKSDCAIPASGRFPLQTVSCFEQSTKGASCVRPSLTSRRFTLQAGRIDEASFQLPVLSSIPDCSTKQDYAVRKTVSPDSSRLIKFNRCLVSWKQLYLP